MRRMQNLWTNPDGQHFTCKLCHLTLSFFLSWVANIQLNHWTISGSKHPIVRFGPNKLSQTIANLVYGRPACWV